MSDHIVSRFRSALPTSLPSPRTPDPRSAPTLRWGVMGTGWIAERFVASLQRHSSQQVVAVGSRNHDSAAAFADQFTIPRSHASYQDLVADPDIDVIYVATPHNAHLEGAMLALEAGKHTVVEKPLAINAAQAQQIAEAAASARPLLHGGALDQLPAQVRRATTAARRVGHR